MIGVANHHHTAAIAPNDMSNSASGVRRVIGSVLREGSVDYLLAGGLPRGQSEIPVMGFRGTTPPHWRPNWTPSSDASAGLLAGGQPEIGEFMRRRVLELRN